MRAKKPTLVITFPTTTAALGWERTCQERGVPGRLIPVPAWPGPCPRGNERGFPRWKSCLTPLCWRWSCRELGIRS